MSKHKKKKKITHRDPIAKSLRSPHNAPQTVLAKKGKGRKNLPRTKIRPHAVRDDNATQGADFYALHLYFLRCPA